MLPAHCYTTGSSLQAQHQPSHWHWLLSQSNSCWEKCSRHRAWRSKAAGLEASQTHHSPRLHRCCATEPLAFLKSGSVHTQHIRSSGHRTQNPSAAEQWDGGRRSASSRNGTSSTLPAASTHEQLENTKQDQQHQAVVASSQGESTSLQPAESDATFERPTEQQHAGRMAPSHKPSTQLLARRRSKGRKRTQVHDEPPQDAHDGQWELIGHYHPKHADEPVDPALHEELSLPSDKDWQSSSILGPVASPSAPKKKRQKHNAQNSR